MKRLKDDSGQTVLEYIFIFGMMALISVVMIKGISTSVNTSMRALGYALSDKLTTGVCESNCFFGNYKNGHQ